MFNRETALVDPDADNKAADADEALQELGADDVAFGYLTTTVVVSDRDARQAGETAGHRAHHQRARFVTIRETLNAVEAWLGSLPGNPYANVRQPIVHTLNLAHMMPVSAVWAGPETNRHLEAPPLMMAETRGSTPFRLDLHVGDVGHTLVVGPTGSGKSVLLSSAGPAVPPLHRRPGDPVRPRALRARRHPGHGRREHELGLEGTLSLQPLARIDEPGEIAFALQWVTALLTNEGVRVTPRRRRTRSGRRCRSLSLRAPAGAHADGPRRPHSVECADGGPCPYTLEGAYGRLLDGASEGLGERRRAARRDGGADAARASFRPCSPTCSTGSRRASTGGRATRPRRGLDLRRRALFAARIREWLKTLRKKNVAVVFATQSLADIERSTIAPALIESCPTRIFLPNDRALEPPAKAVYERFGLNGRQESRS